MNDEQGPDEGKQYSSEDHHQRPVPGKMCSRPRKQADQTSTWRQKAGESHANGEKAETLE